MTGGFPITERIKKEGTAKDLYQAQRQALDVFFHAQSVLKWTEQQATQAAANVIEDFYRQRLFSMIMSPHVSSAQKEAAQMIAASLNVTLPTKDEDNEVGT